MSAACWPKWHKIPDATLGDALTSTLRPRESGRNLATLRPARGGVVGRHRAGRPAADGELADHGHLPRFEYVDQVVEDRVHHRLVEDALVAEGEEVKFQALHLDAPAVGHVRDGDGSKVRLAGHRADAGELGEDEL